MYMKANKEEITVPLGPNFQRFTHCGEETIIIKELRRAGARACARWRRGNQLKQSDRQNGGRKTNSLNRLAIKRVTRGPNKNYSMQKDAWHTMQNGRDTDNDTMTVAVVDYRTCFTEEKRQIETSYALLGIR